MLNLSSIVFSGTFTHILLGVFLLALRLPAAAQTPAWQSARAVATATAAVVDNLSVVSATAVDAVGNVYLAGSFKNSVVLGGTTLTSLGDRDVFMAKFSPVSNQVVWAQRAGGTGSDYAAALAVSGTSVYVVGSFSGAPASFGTTILSNAGRTDAFVAKLVDAGPTGSFAWALRAGGTESDNATALAVSGSGVYVGGHFSSPMVGFGSINLTSAGSYDVFVAKLTDAGTSGGFAWVQRAGGNNADFVSALGVSGNSLYVAGEFYGPTAVFGSTTLVNANASASAGSSDVFVAKLVDVGLSGNFAWAERAGGLDLDYAAGLAVSGASVYVAGNFLSPTASFGPATLVNAGLNNADVFVAKLTDAGPTGGFAWAQRAGGAGEDAATALAVSGTSVYIVGAFDSPTASFGANSLASAGAFDAFAAKLVDAGSSGNFAWAQRAGGTGRDVAYELLLSGTSMYVAGAFASPTASFGAITLTNPTPNTNLGFLASLTDPTLTATAAGRVLNPAQLFPNPARRTATLRLPAGTPSAPLILTDALGRAVRRYPAPAGPETALDLNGLPAGLYLLRGAGPAQRLAVE